MKHNYLLFSYNYLMKKYRKYFSRLQHHLTKGTFNSLSPRRKNFLVNKVEELRSRLLELQPKLTGTLAATALLFALDFAPAMAQPFVENDQKNPFSNHAMAPFTIQNGAQSWTSPAVGDLDHDGDNDILISNSGTFHYYENTGTASAPAFTEKMGTDNPLNNVISVYSYPSLVLTDMDGDMDLDIVAGGKYSGTGQVITYYENTGTVSSPVFTEFSGTNSPFPACSGYTGYGSAAVVDIDGDGDKDVFLVDGRYGSVFFFENTGTATSPSFVETTSGNPFPTGDVTAIGANSFLFTTFADVDGDGDMDALMGQYYNEIIWYKNTGTATAAVMSLQSGTDNPFARFKDEWQAPAMADMNDDGTLDLIQGLASSTIINFNQGTATAPNFPVALTFGTYAGIRLADIDGDSDLDAVFSSDSTPPAGYYVNNGPASAPVFTAVTGTDNPFYYTYAYYSTSFADIDGDMDLDMVSGYNNGTVAYYQNTGTKTAAIFTQQMGTDNPFDGISLGTGTNPTFVDIDGDGDQDLAVGSDNGSIFYFQNTGTNTAPLYVQQTGTDNPFDALATSNASVLSFVNFDGDGDLDLLFGTGFNGMYYYQNTGTATSPMFTQMTGTDNPFDAINTDSNPSSKFYFPAFMDVDADGDQDLLVSQKDGIVKLYENQSTSVVTGVFTSTNNSFGSDVNAYPNPVKDVLNFSLDDAINGNLQVSVLDMKGMELIRQSESNNGSPMSINVSSLTPGIYALRISSDSKTGVVKFIKQ